MALAPIGYPPTIPSSRMLPSSGGRKNSLRVTQARGRERKRYSPLLMRKQVNTIKQNSEGMTVCKHSRIPCKGIVEYNDTLIRLHIPEGQLKVSGRELQIACMSEDSLIVRGFLSGLEYCN